MRFFLARSVFVVGALSATVFGLGAIGCGDDTGAGGSGGGADGPEPLPPLTRAPLTTEEVWVPTQPQDESASRDPRIVPDVEALLDEGFGDQEKAPGEPILRRTLDGSAAPTVAAGAPLISRFVHLSDIQLADDESPARVVNVDSPMGLTGGAFRPQEGHECRILNAAVRTINKLHEATPLDFVVLGGDNIDNAQQNELDWVLSILGSDELVSCDSGVDDDPVSGPNNDPKDPFFAEGLQMPWYWVNGNHDILNQGNIRPEIKLQDYLSDYASVGTRDWSTPGGPVTLGEIPADSARAATYGPSLLSLVKADGDGHGITADAIERGRAFYAADVTPSLRLIVMDTAAPSGSADGLFHRPEIDLFLKPELDRALADGRYVIVTSHHSSGQLTDGGGAFGTPQDDAVLTEEFRDLLGTYPNLLMHLAGHTHHHRVVVIEPPTAPYDYWEVETSALADFPQQMRLIEVLDVGDSVALRLIGLDFQFEGDPIAQEGRALGVMDFTSGWQNDGRGAGEDRNLELFIPKR